MLQRIFESRIDNDDVVLERRRFIRNLACGSLLTFGAPVVGHAARGSFPSHKTLAFQNLNTGDKLKLTYFEKGRYVHSALREIDILLRDYRTGDVHRIDTGLLDQLFDLKQMMGINKPFEIVCGYRSPFTNANLRKHSSGVANNSLHMQGRAIDVRVEGKDIRHLRNAAIALRRGGVGYYPKSEFVHLDTGKFRTW
ncbi:MAG: YcbK family protein [Gammaproteobacteria bacterium]